jgi:hypothetical protein
MSCPTGLANLRPFRFIGFVLFVASLIAGMPRAAHGYDRPEDPTRVSIRFDNVSAKDAFAALAQKAGLSIRYTWGPPLESERITATIVQEPFWSAMARVQKIAHMETTNARREPNREVVLTPHRVMGRNNPVATAVDGLFIATLKDDLGEELFRLKSGPTSKHATQLSISLQAEPKIKPLLWHTIKVEELVDDTGRPLESAALYKAVAFQDGSGTIVFKLKERPWPRKIGRMRVTGKILAAAHTELAEVKDLMSPSPPPLSVGGFRIETATRQGSMGRLITMNMTREFNLTPDWLRPSSRLTLLDPIVIDREGRKFVLHTHDRDWFGRTVRFQLEAAPQKVQKFEKPYGDPYRLLMEIPTDVYEYNVKLEFSDVGLF